jgi:cobalamin biosynthesis protein CobT
MVARARPLVQALERIAWATLTPVELERARDRGSVDEGALHRLALHGDSNVFECPPDSGTPTVALTLLIDCSGSMGAPTDVGSDRLGDAKAVAYAISKVFGARSNFRIDVAGHHAGRNVHYRTCPTLNDIAGLHPRGNNADGFAIQYAVQRLRKVPATRRVLVLVADGYPSAAGYGSEAAERHVRRVVDSACASGVEFLGIGVEGCLEARVARSMYGPGRFVDIGAIRSAGPFLGRFLGRIAAAGGAS